MGLQVPWVVFEEHVKWDIMEGPHEVGSHGKGSRDWIAW